MRWEMKRPALAGSRERPLLQAHCGRLALGYVGVTSSTALGQAVSLGGEYELKELSCIVLLSRRSAVVVLFA
jgi:hypothetical protein